MKLSPLSGASKQSIEMCYTTQTHTVRAPSTPTKGYLGQTHASRKTKGKIEVPEERFFRKLTGKIVLKNICNLEE